jgi:3-deoxy-D-manno-octulosonate 8-phosphate phosphatase (KDO 8-P phosphatase)
MVSNGTGLTGERLHAVEIRARAARLRLVLTDNDGVLTDATVFVSERGEEFVRYSRRDGMGIERLRDEGLIVGIVTRERTEFAVRRAEKLKMKCWTGALNKRAFLATILDETKLTIDQVAYIGDDINDLGILQVVGETGLTAAPADAMPEVKQAVHLVCQQRGGHGAFREFAEWILAHREPTREVAAIQGGQ